MEALDLDVEHHAGVEDRARRLLDVVREALLVPLLGLLELLQERGVVLVLLELGQLVRVTEPALAQHVADELRVLGVRVAEEAAVRDAVRLVVELLGRQLVEVVQRRRLEDAGVQCGDAVDGVREDDGEVRHANLAVPQDGGVPELLLPVGVRVGEALAIAAVDLLDEHVGAGQQVAERADGPLLQRLGHDRVVGVRDGLLRDLEREVEVDAVLVHQKPHELGAAHGGVGVVRVDGDVLAEVLPVFVSVLLLVVAQDRLQARGDEQVLLLQPEQAAVLAGVVRVQDLRDGLDVGAKLHGLGVIAGVERVEVEVLLGGLGAPQAQVVDLLSAVADDGHVVRDGLHELAALLREPVAAVLLVAHDLAAKADEDGALVPAGLPRESVLKPVVHLLDLAAALDGLPEQAVAIAHAVAVAVDAERRHRVEEARGQAAEAAVAKAGVALAALDVVEPHAEVLARGLHDVADAKVQQVVVKQGTKQKLDGEVVHGLLALVVCLLQRVAPERLRLARDEACHGVVALLRAELLMGLGELALARQAVLPDEVVLVGKDLGPALFSHVIP